MKELAVAPSSDGRLQLWVIDDSGGVLSARKAAVDSNADWTDLNDFLLEVGPLPAAAAHVAVAPLSDGRLELWVTLVNGQLFTAWQTQTDPNAAWSGWSDFLAEVGPIAAGVAHVAVAPLSDGRLELWAVDSNGGLFTTWKTQVDANASWSGWSDFLGEVGSVAAGVICVAVAPLSDGRLELWATDSNGGVFTTWKTQVDPNATWTLWSDFLAEVGLLASAVTGVAVAPLQDGRLELWVTTVDGGLFTTWKTQTDPNATWTPWSDFIAEVGPLPARAVDAAVAPLSDGRLELWATDSNGGVSTTWKIGPDPNANWTSWSDFLAEALAHPSWAIILCNLSDVPPGPNARDRYVQFFTSVGIGTGGAFDYWRDVSYGRGGLRGARVFGFIDIGHTRADLQAFSGGAQRQQIWQWGLAAAQTNGIDRSQFPHTIVILNVSADHGAVGGGVVLAYEDSRPFEPTFFAHEMGHGFGLDHSFGESANPCAGGDGRPGAYCDMFDIMSAMNVHSFQDAQNRRTGPTLNALARERLGWLPGSRVWHAQSPLRAETVTLAPINRPDIGGYLFATFFAPSRDPAQVTPSTYTVEYKQAVGWDRGFLTDHVFIHEVRADGLIRLLTNFNGGLLDLDPHVEFVTPDAGMVVRLLGIDAATHTARLRIWPLGAGPRALKISEIDYNPPGPDYQGEYVEIKNDTSASVNMTAWTLRDSANHVFSFPAFVLVPGFSVRVWTRVGTNDAENLFWGRRAAVWNNTGDTAILEDDAGNEIDRFVY